MIGIAIVSVLLVVGSIGFRAIQRGGAMAMARLEKNRLPIPRFGAAASERPTPVESK